LRAAATATATSWESSFLMNISRSGSIHPRARRNCSHLAAPEENEPAAFLPSFAASLKADTHTQPESN